MKRKQSKARAILRGAAFAVKRAGRRAKTKIAQLRGGHRYRARAPRTQAPPRDGTQVNPQQEEIVHIEQLRHREQATGLSPLDLPALRAAVDAHRHASRRGQPAGRRDPRSHAVAQERLISAATLISELMPMSTSPRDAAQNLGPRPVGDLRGRGVDSAALSVSPRSRAVVEHVHVHEPRAAR